VGISVWQLLIILAIVLVLFGAKRMRGLGADLGAAIKGFKQAVRDETPSAGAAVSPATLDSTSDRKESRHL
jgi:sec-independent protein translocase protein TatA